MFTGLIQGRGRVQSLQPRGREARFRIRPEFFMQHVTLGESIACSGVCLTVEAWDGSAFTAYASAETLSRTNLGSRKPGDSLNLERALALGDRLGGHMVSGHVDACGRVDSVTRAGSSTIYRVGFDPAHARLVVDKGSVALDGVSLTVNACGPDWLEVNIIPETAQVTTIGSWDTGYAVNLEFDLIGKYVLRSLDPWLGNARKESPGAGEGIDQDFLRRHGF
jgi:riboflavin synthase